jgi:hypothetical protein
MRCALRLVCKLMGGVWFFWASLLPLTSMAQNALTPQTASPFSLTDDRGRKVVID